MILIYLIKTFLTFSKMDCNKHISWDKYSDNSEEDKKEFDEQEIIDAKKNLFLRKYSSFPLEVKK